jgi:hypothetical protein
VSCLYDPRGELFCRERQKRKKDSGEMGDGRWEMKIRDTGNRAMIVVVMMK